jgi:hypothetical protein
MDKKIQLNYLRTLEIEVVVYIRVGLCNHSKHKHNKVKSKKKEDDNTPADYSVSVFKL